jgi:excisionase family DNA binding protein
MPSPDQSAKPTGLVAPVVVPLLLTTDHAAAFLGASRAAFYRLKSEGKIQAVNLPGDSRPRYKRQDLERLVERLRPARSRRRPPTGDG